jgi:hypothetical protein
MTSDEQSAVDCARAVAAAIGTRDITALRRLLAPDFIHRTLGGPTVELEPFLAAIVEIQGEILSVTLDSVEVDEAIGAALVTGFQEAKVRLDSGLVHDRRAFADWFVKTDGDLRLRVALEPRQE